MMAMAKQLKKKFDGRSEVKFRFISDQQKNRGANRELAVEEFPTNL